MKGKKIPDVTPLSASLGTSPNGGITTTSVSGLNNSGGGLVGGNVLAVRKYEGLTLEPPTKDIVSIVLDIVNIARGREVIRNLNSFDGSLILFILFIFSTNRIKNGSGRFMPLY